MPRKRLTPPPQHPDTGKPLQNKGPEECTVLTVNGRIPLRRRRYAAADVGTTHPLDDWPDVAHWAASPGARALACRLDHSSRCFAKAAAHLARAAPARPT